MSQPPVNVPNRQSKDFAITAEWANSIRESITRLRKMILAQKPQGIFPNDIPPFLATVEEVAEGVFSAECTYGLVIQKKADGDTGDYVKEYLPTGLLYATTSPPQYEGEPIPYTVTNGDYLAVTVLVLPDGTIGHASLPEADWVTFGVVTDITSTYPIDGYEGTPGSIIYPIAKVVTDGDKLKLENIYAGNHIEHEWLNPADIGIDHPWRVVMGDDGVNVGEKEWLVTGGEIYGQGYPEGAPLVVPDITVEGPDGYIVLEITRDATSREITAATITHETTVPTSDYNSHFRVLAQVTVLTEPHVLQLQFEELRTWELMLVANGELKLAAMEMTSRNDYDLPP